VNKFIIFFLISLIPIFSTYGQDPAIAVLENRIIELEERVFALENIILGRDTISSLDDSNYANTLSNWRKIKVSMKEDEIRKILGEPTKIKTIYRGLYIWSYETNIGSGEITFDDQGVRGWREPD
jgi:hypothetical protein